MGHTSQKLPLAVCLGPRLLATQLQDPVGGAASQTQRGGYIGQLAQHNINGNIPSTNFLTKRSVGVLQPTL